VENPVEKRIKSG